MWQKYVEIGRDCIFTLLIVSWTCHLHCHQISENWQSLDNWFLSYTCGQTYRHADCKLVILRIPVRGEVMMFTLTVGISAIYYSTY